MIASSIAVEPSGSAWLRSALPAASARPASIAFSRAAYISAVNPPRGRMVCPPTLRLYVVRLEWVSGLAPWSRSTFTASAWFCAAAHIRAVSPSQLSWAFTSAP